MSSEAPYVSCSSVYRILSAGLRGNSRRSGYCAELHRQRRRSFGAPGNDGLGFRAFLATSPGLNSYTFTWGLYWTRQWRRCVPLPRIAPLIVALTGNSSSALWTFHGYFADTLVSVPRRHCRWHSVRPCTAKPGSPCTGAGNNAMVLGINRGSVQQSGGDR